MKIFITGGLGFVGRALSAALVDLGHTVTVVERNPGAKPPPPEGVSVIAADASRPGPWQDSMTGHDAVVNLAGVSIFTRWTQARKNEIHNSRVLITRNVADALARPKKNTYLLLSTSAVGYYGFHGDEELTEADVPGEDFLASVCRDWESEALKAEAGGVRVVLMRFGVVMGGAGGALDMLRKIFRWRFGNRIGSGKQWFSWIHQDDLISIIVFLLDRRNIHGPVNCTAPSPVTNRELTGALNRAMNTFPLVPPAPGFALKIFLGEFGDFLLRGQRALPRRLLDEGFRFRFPDIDAALRHIIDR